MTHDSHPRAARLLQRREDGQPPQECVRAQLHKRVTARERRRRRRPADDRLAGKRAQPVR